MRIYALLLGTLLTAASGYVAQVAIKSAGADRAAASVPRGDAPDPPGAVPLWYGGELQPIIVGAPRTARPAPTLTGLSRFGTRAECAPTVLERRTTASE